MAGSPVQPSAARPPARPTPVHLHAYGSDGPAELTLYCFSHAGGAAPFYRSWPLLLPTGIALRAVQLPGRQELIATPTFTDIASLVSATAEVIARDADGRPFAFFGHSMGALTAFETARELRARCLPLPRLLGLSAYRAPHLGPVMPTVHTLADDELLARITALGGMPAEILRSPEILMLLLPAIRADWAVLAGYEYREQRPLACPLAVFGGEEDKLAPAQSLQAWQLHSTAGFTLDRYSGGHFYLIRWSSRIVAAMCSRLGW